MSWILVATTGWIALSLVLGLLIGGAVALEERSAGRQAQLPQPSGQPGEGALDGEGAAGTLKVDEHRSLIL